MTEPYISRSQAEAFLKTFAASLEQPSSHPVLLHVWGVGGVGKSRLLRKLQEQHPVDRVAIAKVSFGRTESIDAPIALMKALHSELKPQFPPAPLLRRDVTQLNPPPDAFTQLYEQYFDTLHQLKTESADGKGAASEEQINLVKRIAVFGASAVGMFASQGTVNPAIVGKAGEFAVDLASVGLSEKDRIQQLLQQHPATQKKRELQELISEPVPNLTKAFVKTLIEWSSRRPIALLLDTYEKTSPDVDLWLWRSLLGNHENLRSHPVRLVVMGRHRLLNAEGWRKLQQDLKIGDERLLDRFNLTQTQNYLAEIGITEPEQIQQIYQTTKGLPYYLNWIREQRLSGRAIDFSQGNQEIVNLLLQGLSATQKQVIQWVACCRWFNAKLIQYLLEQQQLDFRTAVDEQLNTFEWLIQRTFFVEFVEGVYRLDDVARDVFRRSLWQEDAERFHHTHSLLADYFLAQSDRAVAPDSPPPAKYNDAAWCSARADFLYYLLLSHRTECQKHFLTHLLEAQYFAQDDIIQIPFQAIATELDEPDSQQLPFALRQFLQQIKPAIEYGWVVLEENPIDYARSQTCYGLSKTEIDRAWQTCLNTNQIEVLTGLAKFTALFYRSRRCPENQRLAWLSKAKVQAEQIAKTSAPEFSSDLLGKNVAMELLIFGHYVEALESADAALKIVHDDDNTLMIRSASLLALNREEEALVSINEAAIINPENYLIFHLKGCILMDLEKLNEALDSFNLAVDLNPKDDLSWHWKGTILLINEDFEGALSSIKEATQINPENCAALMTENAILLFLEDYQEALPGIEKAIQLDPDNFTNWNCRGVALRNLGYLKEAIESYDKSLKLFSSNADAFYGKACCYALQTQIDTSIANLQQAIDLDLECCSLARTDPDFDAIRGDDRFKALLEGSD